MQRLFCGGLTIGKLDGFDEYQIPRVSRGSKYFSLLNKMADLEVSCEWPTFPSDETLHEAFEIEIKTQNGDSVRFGELVAGKGDSITTIVIFGELEVALSRYPTDSKTNHSFLHSLVRHWFCTYDQDYVRNLAGKIKERLLSTVPPNARPAQVIIIGCGDSDGIVPYIETTTDDFPIYSDPTGKIYDKLEMKRTTAFTDPPPYTEHSLRSSFMICMKQIWKRGMAGFRGGSWDQQGGEWIFVNGKLRYAHRMEAANDHLTAEQLVDILKTDEFREGIEVVPPSSADVSAQNGGIQESDIAVESQNDKQEAENL